MVAEFYPPMEYSPIWTYLGVVILLGIAGWALVVWAQTRPQRVPPPPPLPPGWRMARLRGEYIDRIDEIVRLAEGHEMSTREAHQQLSVTLRQFVHEASGVRAPTMTLAELGRTADPSLRPVADVVRGIYPVEFGPEREGSVGRAASYAREVVARWT